jgi:hypothetical protein
MLVKLFSLTDQCLRRIQTKPLGKELALGNIYDSSMIWFEADGSHGRGNGNQSSNLDDDKRGAFPALHGLGFPLSLVER